MATANIERGEVPLRVVRNGETVEYVLKLSMNAAVAMQRKLKKPLAAIAADLQNIDVEVIREIAYMVLQKYHASEINTVEKAGDLIDEAGGPVTFLKAFDQLNQAAQGPGGPNAAAAQTTETSTSGSSTSEPGAQA